MASAPSPARRIARFAGAERALHWLLAVTFFLMLGSGLALFVPDLATLVARPTAKAWHLNSALALATGVLALFAAHGLRLRATMREMDRFDRDDLRWLFGWSRLLRGEPAPPQRRFNAGQKLNSALVAGLLVVLFVTGLLLLLGERDTRFRLDGTVVIHDWATWILIGLVAAHLYLAMIHPSTRHALRGITRGDVDREWARRHHRTWVEEEEASESTASSPDHPDEPQASERVGSPV